MLINEALESHSPSVQSSSSLAPYSSSTNTNLSLPAVTTDAARGASQPVSFFLCLPSSVSADDDDEHGEITDGILTCK